jgi:hypothetical protein
MNYVAIKCCLILLAVISLVTSCKKEEPESTEPNQVFILAVTATPTASESVTLKNNTGAAIDISGWIIGDLNNPSAYNIPNGNTLNQGASVTFNASTMGFQINDSGETIYLKNSSGGLVDTWTN